MELGKINTFPSDLFDNENLYLEVKIFSTDTGWETLSPREQITSVSFAFKAGDADTLDGYDSTDLAAANHTHNGEDITSGIVYETYIDQAITRDSELATHAANPSVHHPKTTSFSEITDMVTDSQIPDNITINYAKDADRVDGKHASEFGDGHSLDAADGDPVDVVYVNNEGNVGIGTMTVGAKLDIAGNAVISGIVGIGTTIPSYKLYVNGTAYATGAAGVLSDRRNKTNISDLSFDALEVVNDLHPVTFEWKEPQDSGMEGTQLGFIAQEVEGVLPEAVLTQDNEEQTKGLKYNALIPLLTKAIQELEAQNKVLRAENNGLRHEIEQIKEAIGL